MSDLFIVVLGVFNFLHVRRIVYPRQKLFRASIEVSWLGSVLFTLLGLIPLAALSTLLAFALTMVMFKVNLGHAGKVGRLKRKD